MPDAPPRAGDEDSAVRRLQTPVPQVPPAARPVAVVDALNAVADRLQEHDGADLARHGELLQEFAELRVDVAALRIHLTGHTGRTGPLGRSPSDAEEDSAEARAERRRQMAWWRAKADGAWEIVRTLAGTANKAVSDFFTGANGERNRVATICFVIVLALWGPDGARTIFREYVLAHVPSIAAEPVDERVPIPTSSEPSP